MKKKVEGGLMKPSISFLKREGYNFKAAPARNKKVGENWFVYTTDPKDGQYLADTTIMNWAKSMGFSHKTMEKGGSVEHRRDFIKEVYTQAGLPPDKIIRAKKDDGWFVYYKYADFYGKPVPHDLILDDDDDNAFLKAYIKKGIMRAGLPEIDNLNDIVKSEYYAYFVADADNRLEKGGSVGKLYFLSPYVIRTGDILEGEPKFSEQMQGSLEQAILRAKEMIKTNQLIKEVSVVRIGASVLKNKKVALVYSDMKVEKFQDGGEVHLNSVGEDMFDQMTGFDPTIVQIDSGQAIEQEPEQFVSSVFDERMAKGGSVNKCPVGTEIQTLIFEKALYSPTRAKAWAKKHDMKYEHVDSTEDTNRIRQKEPTEFRTDSFRTITLTEGVKAVIGCPISKMGNGGNLSEAIDKCMVPFIQRNNNAINADEILIVMPTSEYVTTSRHYAVTDIKKKEPEKFERGGSYEPADIEAGKKYNDTWYKQKQWNGNPALGYDAYMKHFQNPFNGGRMVPVYLFGKEGKGKNTPIWSTELTPEGGRKLSGETFNAPDWTYVVSAGANSDYSHSGGFYPETPTLQEAMNIIDGRYENKKLIYADGGEIEAALPKIKGLDVYEEIYLYIKRGIKSGYRAAYLEAADLWNNERVKKVEQSLMEKHYLNAGGAITESGRVIAKDIDRELSGLVMSYLGTYNKREHVGRIKKAFEDYSRKFELGGVIDFSRPQIGAVQTVRLDEALPKFKAGGTLGDYKVFVVFNNGSAILYKDFELMPNRYIRAGSNEPLPIEDYGDWMLFETDVTEEQAMDAFIEILGEGESDAPKYEAGGLVMRKLMLSEDKYDLRQPFGTDLVTIFRDFFVKANGVAIAQYFNNFISGLAPDIRTRYQKEFKKYRALSDLFEDSGYYIVPILFDGYDELMAINSELKVLADTSDVLSGFHKDAVKAKDKEAIANISGAKEFLDDEALKVQQKKAELLKA